MSSLVLPISLLSLLIYSSIIAFLICGFLRLKLRGSNVRPAVSVIVAARNEEKALSNCLDALLAQNYPTNLTQLLIVNDRSTDATAEVLKEYEDLCTNLEVIAIAESGHESSPKKRALSAGISKASGDIIFTTDADCLPPPSWIAETVRLFEDDTGLVIGIAPFLSKKERWNQLLELDNLTAAFVAAGAAGWDIGVTCTGRNLAYRKSIFEDVNGFTDINKSLSGDDDLFLQLVKKRTHWKIRYALNPASAVPSQAPATLADFIKQRRRHVSAGRYYSSPLKLAYLLFNLANAQLWGLFFVGLFNRTFLTLGIVMFGMKLLLDYVALLLMTSKLKRTYLMRMGPVWEVFNLVNQCLISPLGFIGRVSWK